MAGQDSIAREQPSRANSTASDIHSRREKRPAADLRLAVVSKSQRTLAPREVRARRVGEVLLGLGWECIPWPGGPEAQPGSASRSRPLRRKALRAAQRHLLLDRHEPLSRAMRPAFKRLAVDAGYLVSPAISPAIVAGKVLRSQRLPYVIDSGDPWEMVLEAFDSEGRAASRVRRMEEALFSGASGVVVTTVPQGEVIAERFPGIPILVRPNGFQGEAVHWSKPPGGGEPGVLRLAHFGRFDRRVRLDPLPFLESLVGSGGYRRVELAQYGPDRRAFPQTLPPGISIEFHEVIPWPEVIREAPRFDAALVIGNLPGREVQLPSKAIEYLSLPIPRIALSSSPEDALHRYAGEMPGYLVVDDGDPGAGSRVAAHLGRKWTPEELEPPESESWRTVAGEIARFVDSCLRSNREGVAP